MPEWPANGTTDWNAKMNAFVRTEHNADGTHNTTDAYTDVREYTSFALAISGIGSTETTLMIPNTQAVSANITVPSNVTMWFLNGGSLVIANGVTVTINGDVQAGLFKIFDLTGTGNVVWGSGSVKEVCPQWWGAVADSTGVADSGTNDQPAFVDMLASMPTISGGTPFANAIPKMVIPDGQYRMTTAWTLNVDQIDVDCGRATRFVGDTGIANDVILIIDMPVANARWWRLTNFHSNGKTVRMKHAWHGEIDGLTNGAGAVVAPSLDISPDGGAGEGMYYNVFKNTSGGPLRFGNGSSGTVNSNQFIGGNFHGEAVDAFIINDGLTDCHGNLFLGTEFFATGGSYAINDEFGIAATGNTAKNGNVAIGCYIESGGVNGNFGWIIGSNNSTITQGMATVNTVATPDYDGGYEPNWQLNNWTTTPRIFGSRNAGFMPIHTENIVRDGCGANGVLDFYLAAGGWGGNAALSKVTTLTDGSIPSRTGSAIQAVFGAEQNFFYLIGDDALRQIAAHGFCNISFWARQNSGGDNVGIEFVTSGANVAFGVNLTADDEWHRYNATIKVADSITYARITWATAAGDTGTATICDLMITPGKFCIPYSHHVDDSLGAVARVQTTDATVTSLWAHTLPDTMSYLVEAHVLGKESDGSNRNAYVVRALVYRSGGAAVMQGAVEATYSEESDASWGIATLDVNTNDVRLRVQGVAATTINWEAKIKIVAL